MGDVTINDAIDLKHILTPRHRGDRLDALNDKGYHKIYEALFRVASAEKSSYGKATKANVKSQAAARLASCASVLRLAVEAGVRKLKQRSVKALIDHFTQTLPLPSGAFCEPLSLDYTKALRVILEFQPHVEHFGTAEWNLLVNFCCEGIKTHQGASGDPASSFSTDLSVRLASNGTPSKNSGATGLSGSSQDPGLQSKSIAEELVLSLEQLLLPDKMPSIDSAQSIFATFVQFLQLTAAVGRAHHAAFSAFNRCLSRTRTDYISLTQEAITQALPLIRRLWATKSASLRDEMLVTLIHAQDYLEKMVRDDRDLDVPAELERLLDVVQMEYSKRLDREQLQLEDVALSLGLVGYGSIADVVDSMISSIDLNGPALLTDSALSFLTVLLELRRSENPGLVSMTTERLIHWLISRWSPAKLTDRYAAFQYAQQANPGLVFDLLAACMGWLRHEIPSEIVPAYGTLAQAWVSHIQNQELIRYLLLLGDPSPSSGWNELGEWAKLDDQQETGVSHRQNEYIILEFCTSEFDRALGSWNAQVSERVQYINSDMPEDISKAVAWSGLKHMVNKLSSALEIRRMAERDHIGQVDLDDMDIDDGFESQRSLLKREAADADFPRHYADRILVHLGQQCLQAYDLWSQDLNDDLSETGTSLYQWFIDVALEKGIASSKVQMDIANLLQRLLQVEPDYAKGISTLSSVRTSLLKVLQDGDMSVKFHVTERIEDIFALFVLKRHDAIFEDVLSSLPRDADWKAGIALRMLVLARLASSWYTLLRRCVYHIFETPGLIPDAAGHAARCLSEVSKRLKLRDSRELLGLFLPQILYTWLETQPLQLIPFSIFGYDSLLELLRDIRHEATSQLVMRGHDDQVASLAASLSVRFEDLIIQSFDKAMAYSVARDISLPPAEGSTHHVGGEVRIRKRLGKDAFLLQVQLRFAQTVALFFRCVEQEDQVERAFQKRPHFEYAAEIWMQIKGFSCSESALPVNQQPSFRARYLLDEIHHLCHRTKHDATQIWKPSLLTFILRTLLDSIHPALGSLHACSVIRRVRILVSIAGDSILRDYPLEMLLHSLRPFLTDPQCAEDTIVQTGSHDSVIIWRALWTLAEF
ncbi:MAG: Serine/threonine-protein kinase tel1 [Thelocarpon impressellum]|nr:MAG: Serine/threonine-protein kinase tel1 [Thelocarpon impressellum]